MSPNSNFVILYPTSGSVYLRWTLCSITSVLRRGNYHGEILVIVKDEIEATIVRKIYPQVKTLVVDVEKPSKWPAYTYKAVLLYEARNRIITEKGNVMLFDSDILVYEDLNPLLHEIDGHLWIDRMYNKSKSERYQAYVAPICEKLGMDYDRDYFEYNSGCWNIPAAHYSKIITKYGKMLHRDFKVDHRGNPIGWTDQPFFTISCMRSGLEPKVLEDRLWLKNQDLCVFAHDERVGIKHFHGQHRRNKEDWQSTIEEEGFLDDLYQMSSDALDDAEHLYLWQDNYCPKAFFPADAFHHRLWRKLKQLILGSA